MKPVDMTVTHDPDNGSYGDCFRACLASLLELPITAVPHIMDGNPDQDEFNRRTSAFLKLHGLFFMEIPIWDLREWMDACGIDDIWHTITGDSPNFADTRHCVVGHNGRIAHDPAPSRKGLTGEREKWVYGFLVRLNGESQ
jgi:hypothetical protein